MEAIWHEVRIGEANKQALGKGRNWLPMNNMRDKKITLARLDFMKKLVIEAGGLTLKGFGNCQHVEKANKYGYDILTDFDLLAEQMIKEAITEQYGEAIIGEECGLLGDSTQAKERVWIVDPIDGTINYQHAIPLYGISIGYCENGIPVAGVIFLPALGELFFAGKGMGTTLYNTHTKQKQSILVDKEEDVKKIIIAMEGEWALQEALQFYFDGGFSYRSLQIFRCSVFTLSYIASGRIHLYLNSLLNLWDCAAGDVIIREAGGEPCRDVLLNPIFPNMLNHYLDLAPEARKVFRFNLVVSSSHALLAPFVNQIVKPAIRSSQIT